MFTASHVHALLNPNHPDSQAVTFTAEQTASLLNNRIIDAIFSIVRQLQLQGVKQMATLQQILDEVTAQTTQLGSINTLIQGIQTQLAAALSGTTIPPAVQTQIDAIFAQAKQNDTLIANALAANVPPTPPATPPATPPETAPVEKHVP